MRAVIERRTRRYYKLTYAIPCVLCNDLYAPYHLELHEYPSRGVIQDKLALEVFPTCLHFLLCRECHGGYNGLHPNSYTAGQNLLRWSIELWGKAAVRNQIWRFNQVYRLSSLYIDYSLLED